LIGVEKVEEVLLKAARKAKELQLPNLALLWVDVRELDKIFAPGEVDRLYINFCDPWPRRRHAKRRLTHTRFLQIYAKILKQDGEIHFKTDNEELFEFSLNEFSENGWKLKNICLDVAKRGPEDNITTEYEEKFQELGSPIYRCEAVKMSQGTVL
jgi:tRNA (guanine-N7-)-methyltransferase